MNIKNVDNVYRQYIKSGRSYAGTSKVFNLNENKTGIKQDSLSFSSEAALLRCNAKTVREYASDITAGESDERIDALRQKIKNGEYNVGAKQVADSILNRYV